jgi:hypothetical protein
MNEIDNIQLLWSLFRFEDWMLHQRVKRGQ